MIGEGKRFHENLLIVEAIQLIHKAYTITLGPFWLLLNFRFQKSIINILLRNRVSSGPTPKMYNVGYHMTYTLQQTIFVFVKQFSKIFSTAIFDIPKFGKKWFLIWRHNEKMNARERGNQYKKWHKESLQTN